MQILVTRKDVNFKMPDNSTKNIPTLIPAFDHQYAPMQKLPFDRIVTINTKVSRCANLNSQIWAIANYVYDNLPENYEFPSIDNFMDYVKLRVGFANICKINGKTKAYPKSMAFVNCEENAFRQQLYNPALEWMAGLLKMDRDKLISASQEYTGIDHRYKRFK